ncbi:capsular polysaccharide transport system permease protein [Ferrimonas marina]|uniref:Capsular polysaccharide transport system permease protein n=2 Tax=Ferrimonas marina TaxID=299255 RepID=A0A1M5VKA9_9GAMM|nr:capsular polysaccharide transport system permease protein [Ferrimonas marina]
MSTTVKESGSQDKAFSSRLIERMRTPTFLLVVLPILLFAFYQLVWASERYESRAQVIVQQPNDLSAMDPSMALLSGFGLSTPASTDALLVQAFIYSDDMLSYLDDRLSLRTHYTESGADLFSRLSSTASKEDFLDFYQSHVTVEIDEKSSVITVLAQAFDEEFAHQLNVAIVERAEWYINSIGHTLANEQLAFVRGEHQLIESRLDNAKRRLLGFQQQYNLLDPEAEGMALQQIAYSLESQLASKKAELKSLRSVMSDEAPQVMTLQSQVRALEAQLENERSRLSLQRRNESSEEGSLALGELSSVSEVLATYTEFKVELELALQAYTASEVSLEKSRIEAYRQLKYLMIVESPTSPESNQYPKVLYNLALFSAVILMLFAIGRIIVATARELR